MHCPECHSLNETGAASCTNCGLLLLQVKPEAISLLAAAAPAADAPKRRAEDFAHTKRRAADREMDACKFCGGEVAKTATRCRHCSEIINDEFYRERAQRLRSRINYASWVAYLFGLAALLVFRPVGLMSIAGGLLLSIIYYAIPVDPPPPHGQKRPGGIAGTIKKQLKMERVAIPIPRLNNKRLVFVGTPLIAALVGYSANVLLLQRPMNDVLKESSAFAGMQVSAHYQYWVVPGVVVYDLQDVGIRQTPIDVHTAFLEFAKKLKEKRYSRVELSYKGTTRFSIDGNSFAKIGTEYAKRNYDYVLYRIPRMFHPEDGAKAPTPGSTGRDSLLQFHRAWYGEDQLTKSVANGM
ncbi:MAG: hypothetical protein JWO56_398 [Acidobacteria bacterium]|nr:hypothetical protein [Acidobacteriota bacterium]